MKQLLILLTVCVAFVPLHSQSSESYSEKKNEITIGFLDVFQQNNNSAQGITYKRTSNIGAYRIGTGLSFYLDNRDLELADRNTISYKFNPKIGYEFHKYLDRYRIQYGADLVGNISKYKYDAFRDPPQDDITEVDKNIGISVRPFVGLNVFLTKSISISTETYLSFNYNKETRTSTRELVPEIEKTYTVYMGPSGIVSINFHF